MHRLALHSRRALEGRFSASRHGSLVLATLLVAVTVPGTAVPGPAPRTFALRAGRIHTVSGPALEDATVLVLDGKIAAVGKDVQVPAGVPVIHLPRHTVMPGLIDAETSLAMESRDVPKSLSPEVLAADGWDFYADRRRLLRGGVTTVYVAPGSPNDPGSSVRVVSGRGLVVKTGGAKADPRARVLREAAGVQVTLGESPKRPPRLYDPPVPANPDRPFEVVAIQAPQTRAGELTALRGLLDGARRVRERALAAGAGAAVEDEAPARGAPPAASGPPSVEEAVLVSVVAGEDVLRIRANKARDILHALRLAREYGLRMVLEGGWEAHLLVRELAEQKVPVVVAGGFRPGVLPSGDIAAETQEGLYRDETILELIRAGVPVVVHSPSNNEVEDLLSVAASLARMGLEPAEALRIVTLGAAEVLGVESRVGSLEPGKDADLVVLGGDLFSPYGKPQGVFIDGDLVFDDGPDELPEGARIVRSGLLYTGRGDAVAGGVVVTAGRKVHYAGPGAFLQYRFPGAPVVDAVDEVVVPGLIDAGSAAGLHVDSLTPLQVPLPGSVGGSARATFRPADGIDPADRDFQELLRAGITTVLLSPEPTGPFCGQMTAWKTSGQSRDQVTLRSYAALLLRSDAQPQEIKKAKDYHEQRKKWEDGGKKGDEPGQREDYDAFRPIFTKEVPVVVLGQSLGAASGLARVLQGDFGARAIVAGAGDGSEGEVETIRQLGGRLALMGPFLTRQRGEVVNVLRRLGTAGLQVALRSGVGAGARELPAQVALAVQEGLPVDAALATLTIQPAVLFGLDERIGTLAEGKDADLVFLSGTPFSWTTRVTRVMVEGEFRFQSGGRP